MTAPSPMPPSVVDAAGAGRSVLIHVFDEYRKTSKDFVCPRDVLLDKMRYFRAYLTPSNEQDEIDISVHCDVEIFEWLVVYMHESAAAPDWRPKMTLENIASILVSSEFLQMDALVDECIGFITQRMQDFLYLRVDFSCLSDAAISKMAERCSVQELERLSDPKDKLLSKLYRKKLEAFLRDLRRAGTELQSCEFCLGIYTTTDESHLRCPMGSRVLSVHGELVATHRRRTGWAVGDWAKYMATERGIPWSGIFRFVWACAQSFECAACHRVCRLVEIHDCVYHDGPVVGDGADARYGCCDTRVFHGGDVRELGCKRRDHMPVEGTLIETQRMLAMVQACWAQIETCALAVGPPTTSTRPPAPVGMSVLFPAPPQETPPELAQLLRRAPPPTMDAASPRRRRQWRALRLQEQDRVRTQHLALHLVQQRANASN